MRLVNEKPTGSNASDTLDEIKIVIYYLHAVNEYTWVREEYYLTFYQVLMGNYGQWAGKFSFVPYLVVI